MNVLHKYLETFQIFLPIVIHQVCDKEQKLYHFSRRNANKTKHNPDTKILVYPHKNWKRNLLTMTSMNMNLEYPFKILSYYLLSFSQAKTVTKQLIA